MQKEYNVVEAFSELEHTTESRLLVGTYGHGFKNTTYPAVRNSQRPFHGNLHWDLQSISVKKLGVYDLISDIFHEWKMLRYHLLGMKNQCQIINCVTQLKYYTESCLFSPQRRWMLLDSILRSLTAGRTISTCEKYPIYFDRDRLEIPMNNFVERTLRISDCRVGSVLKTVRVSSH